MVTVTVNGKKVIIWGRKKVQVKKSQYGVGKKVTILVVCEGWNFGYFGGFKSLADHWQITFAYYLGPSH